MRNKLVFAILTVAVMVAIAFNLPQSNGSANQSITPVVVELFTSEGCSSCPPADKLFIQLQQQHTLDNAELILLGEHVDYWNGLGWKDRFSSSVFTERQKQYVRTMRLSSAYTPQAVVDGHIDVLGSDEGDVEKAIARAAGSPKPAQVAVSWTSPELLRVSVTNAPSARVLLAITEDGLTTQVDAGENGGRTLRHAAVVRELREIGVTKSGSYDSAVKVNLRPEWNAGNSRAIVLVQPENGQILGAAALKR